MNDMMCEYCGSPQGERLTCCGEQHWVPIFDWRKEDRSWESINDKIDAAENGEYDHLRQEEP